MARQRIANQTKGMGKPKVGGPFELVDHNGKPFTHEDLLGRYSLVRLCNIAPSSISISRKNEIGNVASNTNRVRGLTIS